MKEVLEYLDERRAEFEQHMLVARMIESRITDGSDNSGARVEIRHVNTIKSGLLIHIYNIVEAVTTRTLQWVGASVAYERPARWKDSVLGEWVRSQIWNSEERLGDGAFKRLKEASSTLASGAIVGSFEIKGEPGSWDDEAIKKVAKRLGCSLKLPRAVQRAAYERKYLNQATALKYVASRRNALAHGESTFEDGAKDLTLDDLAEIADRILPFLREVCVAYQMFIDSEEFLKVEEAAD